MVEYVVSGKYGSQNIRADFVEYGSDGELYIYKETRNDGHVLVAIFQKEVWESVIRHG